MTISRRSPGVINKQGDISDRRGIRPQRPIVPTPDLNQDESSGDIVLPSPAASRSWAIPTDAGLPRVLLVAPQSPPPVKGGVEKGVGLLLQTRLARDTGMSLFNTYRRRDANRSRVERLWFQAAMVGSFWERLKREAPDLVHVKTSSGINFYQNSLYCQEARFRRVPVLLQIHSGRFEAFYRSSPQPLRAWIRHTLQSVDRVVVLSEYWRERIWHIAPTARVQVIPNGLGRDELEALRNRPGTPTRQVFFLGTGKRALNRDKGLDDLQAVLPRLARRHPTARWVIAGLEDPEAFRRRLAAQWEAPRTGLNNVRCLPTIDSRRKIAMLKESSILALPSHFENMPNLLLEGMAAGLGVVATGVGAVPEMLDAGRGGIVIEPEDRAALADGLDRLLGDPVLVRRQGRHNESRVALRYTMPIVEELFGSLYREVAGVHAHPSTRGAAVGALVPVAAQGRTVLVPGGTNGGEGAPSSTWTLARGAFRVSATFLTPGSWTTGRPAVPLACPPPRPTPFVPESTFPELVPPPRKGRAAPHQSDCSARQKRLD